MTKSDLVFVYDGDCAFCTLWMRRFESILDRFPETQPWQWLDLDELGLTHSDVTSYAWFLTGRRRYRGHAAFAALLRMQASPGSRFLSHLLTTPPCSWVAGACYQLIARLRYRLPGSTAACAVPKPVG